jgi:hypothetical protein
MPRIIVDTSTNITYTLSISQLNTTIVDGISNVVTHVHWKLQAVDSHGHSVSNNGTVPYTPKAIQQVDRATKATVVAVPADFDPENYTPYEDLTEEQVINWIYDDLIIPQAMRALAERLSKIHMAPTTEVPWATNSNPGPSL